MKHLKTVITGIGLIAVALMTGCGGSGRKGGDLSGLYVRSFEGAFSVGMDTLRLSKTDQGDGKLDLYTIYRSFGYQKIVDGQLQPDTLYKQQQWKGTYDPEHQILNIRPSGKVLTVNSHQKAISLGEGIYQKIK